MQLLLFLTVMATTTVAAAIVSFIIEMPLATLLTESKKPPVLSAQKTEQKESPHQKKTKFSKSCSMQ